MVRDPAVAGQFYPGTEQGLRSKIEDCFEHDIGPGSIPKEEGDSREISGLVVPHAGYVYSGPVAAHSYKALYKDGMPDTFVIVGPNHHGFGSNVALEKQDFKTPLGTVEVDTEMVDKLVNDPMQINSAAHKSEHSIEVQLPFLQYFKSDFKIIPISFIEQDFKTAKEVGRQLNELTKDRDICIIASTDFSHYVLEERAHRKDKMAIDKILENDPEGLYKTVEKERISMCGYGPVIAMMIGSNGEKGELLKYATSGDVMDMKEVVGYGALSFE